MGVLQSLARGTVLAAFGIGGWLLEQSVGYLGGILASVTGAALPVEVAWMLACGLGIVIGDILAVLAGNDVEVGRAAGIAKGLIASIGGLIHSASAYPRLQARVKRTIAYISTDDSTAGFPTVYDSFKTPQRHSV